MHLTHDEDAGEVVGGDDALVERERRLHVVQLRAVRIPLHDVAAADVHHESAWRLRRADFQIVASMLSDVMGCDDAPLEWES